MRHDSSFKQAGMELEASLVILEKYFCYAHSTVEYVFSLFSSQLQDLICGAQWWQLGWSALSTAQWYVKSVISLLLYSLCKTGISSSHVLPSDCSYLLFFLWASHSSTFL